MKTNPFSRIVGRAVVMTACLAAFGCSRSCSGDNMALTSDEALPLEQVELSTTPQVFITQAAEMLGTEAAPATLDDACRQQDHHLVPDIPGGFIEERSSGGRSLLGCTLKAQVSTRARRPSEIRAELVDDRVARIVFRFKVEETEAIRAAISKRFGPGDPIELEDRTLIAGGPRKYHYWKRGDELWLLGPRGEATLRLVHQNLFVARRLRPQPEPGRKHVPVSLEDLGIGALDLDAPEPEVLVPAHDGGHFDAGGPTSASKK